MKSTTIVSYVGLLSTTVSAIGSLRGEEKIDPTIATTFKWQDPFGEEESTPAGFEATCEATGTFYARQHTLRDHMAMPPHGFLPWAEALKPVFGGRAFPGSWDGVDHHGTMRRVMVMEYSEVPEAVKDWIETHGDGVFGVYDKPSEEKVAVNVTAKPRTSKADKGEGQVMIFAAGALYDILPLWVAGGSKCEAEMSDLDRYNSKPKDGGVVAWPVEHTEPDRRRDKRDVMFKVKAQLLKQSGAAKAKEAEKAKEAAKAKESKAEEASQVVVEQEDPKTEAKTETKVEESKQTESAEANRDEL